MKIPLNLNEIRKSVRKSGRKLKVLKLLTAAAAKKIAAKSPEFARVLKRLAAQYPNATPIVLIGAGVVAIIVGNKMVVAGAVLAGVGVAGAAAALAAGQPQLAALAALAALLGLKSIFLGVVFKLAGIAVSVVGALLAVHRCYFLARKLWLGHRSNVTNWFDSSERTVRSWLNTGEERGQSARA
jgi:hypothetical protein